MLKISASAEVEDLPQQRTGFEWAGQTSNLANKRHEGFEEASRIQRVKQKQPIYLPGDKALSVYFLKKGRVKISRITQEGKEFTLAMHEPGEIFGELEVLEEIARDTRAEALDDVWVGVLERNEFSRLLLANPELMFQLTRLIGLRLKRLESRVEDLLFQDVPTRLARILLILSTKNRKIPKKGVGEGLRITHQELANLIGSTRETVSATLNDFKRQGLVELGHRLITIRNQDKFALMQ
jgi:CRP/FNR family transcriptional regulator, cyclic AMP receptor protein